MKRNKNLFQKLLPLLILMGIFGENKRDRRRSDMGRWTGESIIMLAIAIAIFSEIWPIIAGLALAAGGYFLYKAFKEELQREKRNSEYQKIFEKNPGYKGTGNANNSGYRGRDYQNGSYKKAASQSSSNGSGSAYEQSSSRPAQQPKKVRTSLPRRASRRRKILSVFDKKYDLCLTDEQMTSIVNSSYMSEVWRKELEAMQEKYDNVTEWLCGGSTEWLRAYMYVFRIQEITSDITAQEEIVKYSFESIFQYVDTLSSYGLSEKIRMVNAKYFTNFDDITFMAAYRFLESKGLSHDLTTVEVPAYHEMSEADRLTEMYS